MQPWLALSAAFALSGGALTAQVLPIRFSEMVGRSELIVIGTVERATSRYENGKRTIRTYTTLHDLTVVKGKDLEKLTLRFEGGRVGNDRLTVGLMPVLVTGRRYLLYIRGNGRRFSPITGYHQGVFEITRRNGVQVLRNTLGAELVGIRDDRLVFARGPAQSPRPPSRCVDDRGRAARPLKRPVQGSPPRARMNLAALIERTLREANAKGGAR